MNGWNRRWLPVLWMLLTASGCHPLSLGQRSERMPERTSGEMSSLKTPKMKDTEAAGSPFENAATEIPFSDARDDTGEIFSSEIAGHPYFSRMPNGNAVDTRAAAGGISHSTVLIVIDALNARHLGMYGYERNTSPNLDALAKEGVVCTQWISNSSWTRPSFTTILTGVPKGVHQMELTDRSLSKQIDTMAERYRRHGYRTAAFVGNPLIQKKWRYHQGFERFDDSAAMGDFPRAEELVNRALDWLYAQPERAPVLLVLFVTDPHAPYDPIPGARVYSKSFDNVVTLPPREVKTPFAANIVQAMQAAYDDEIAYADGQIGRLFVELKKMGRFETSTIAVTADHGEIFGAHDCFQHAYHMWEPVLRVPFIIRAPGIAAPGVTDVPATHTDVLPTLMHLSGFGEQTEFGVSIFSKMYDRTAPILSAYDARGVLRTAARMGEWKLIRYDRVNRALFEGVGIGTEVLEQNPSLMIPGPRYELYDMRTDSNETMNLYGAHQDDEAVVRLKNAILENGSEKKGGTKKKRNSPVPALDEDTLNALKAAGYIQ